MTGVPRLIILISSRETVKQATKKKEESSGRRSGRLILFIRLCQELYSHLGKTKIFGIQVNVRKGLTFTFARMAAETLLLWSRRFVCRCCGFW